jgi:hypothetical protein
LESKKTAENKEKRAVAACSPSRLLTPKFERMAPDLCPHFLPATVVIA